MIKILTSIACVLLLAISPNVTLAQGSSLFATISINPKADIERDRVVVLISGTYTCGSNQDLPPGNTVLGSITLDVSQAAGRQIKHGFIPFNATCNGIEQTFQVNVQSDNIPWHGGPARVHANLFVQECSTFQCPIEYTSSDVSTQIQIQGGGH